MLTWEQIILDARDKYIAQCDRENKVAALINVLERAEKWPDAKVAIDVMKVKASLNYPIGGR